jgi:membrane protein DedA with SNARE-associated domain
VTFFQPLVDTIHTFTIFLQQTLTFSGSIDFTIVLLGFFLVCVIGEFGIAIPLLLETAWTFAGYNVGSGALSPLNLFIIWLAAQAGRQLGSLALYWLTRSGSVWLLKIYKKHFEKRMQRNKNLQDRLVEIIKNLSPFSVALGRLVGLRFPLAMALGTQKKLLTLVLGVLLSSIIWDGIYITFGTIFGRTLKLESWQIFICSLGFTFVYAGIFVLRRWHKGRKTKLDRKPPDSAGVS